MKLKIILPRKSGKTWYWKEQFYRKELFAKGVLTADIRGKPYTLKVYVRFGGEYSETYYSNIIRRWVLTLHINPNIWLKDVLTVINDHPINKIKERLPHIWITSQK